MNKEEIDCEMQKAFMDVMYYGYAFIKHTALRIKHIPVAEVEKATLSAGDLVNRLRHSAKDYADFSTHCELETEAADYIERAQIIAKTIIDREMRRTTLFFSGYSTEERKAIEALAAAGPIAYRSDQWTPEELAAHAMRSMMNMCQGCFRPVAQCKCAELPK